MILECIAERVAEDETTDYWAVRQESGIECVIHTRVAVTVCTMRVELTSSITFRNVDLREVTMAGDLYVVRRLHKVDTGKRTVRDRTSATTSFRAPCDFFALRFSNGTDRGRGPPVTPTQKFFYRKSKGY